MSLPAQEAAQSLLSYLKTRNWAAQRLATFPPGSNPEDINIALSLYISFAFSAIDLVKDELPTSEKQNYINDLVESYGEYAFAYARELRNAIVHRGQDTHSSGIVIHQKLVFMLPLKVTNRGGNVTHARPVERWTDFASSFNHAVSAVISKYIEAHDWIPEHASQSDAPQLRTQLTAIGLSLDLDFEQIAEDIVSTRRRNVLAALGVA